VGHPRALNIRLIDTIARRTLAAGRDTIVEGILAGARYGKMLRALVDDHLGPTVCANLDVPFDETVRRHSTRTQSTEFTADEMATWWVPHDRLGIEGELVIDHRPTVLDAVRLLTASPGGSSTP
jgi:hypothetical protein